MTMHKMYALNGFRLEKKWWKNGIKDIYESSEVCEDNNVQDNGFPKSSTLLSHI